MSPTILNFGSALCPSTMTHGWQDIREVEDVGTSIPKLLVAPDVSVHRTIHEDLQSLHLNQGPKAASDRRT